MAAQPPRVREPEGAAPLPPSILALLGRGASAPPPDSSAADAAPASALDWAVDAARRHESAPAAALPQHSRHASHGGPPSTPTPSHGGLDGGGALSWLSGGSHDFGTPSLAEFSGGGLSGLGSGLPPLSPPLSAALGEAFANNAGREGFDLSGSGLGMAGRDLFTGAVLSELASSALELLQAEQQGEAAMDLPPFSLPESATSTRGDDRSMEKLLRTSGITPASDSSSLKLPPRPRDAPDRPRAPAAAPRAKAAGGAKAAASARAPAAPHARPPAPRPAPPLPSLPHPPAAKPRASSPLAKPPTASPPAAAAAAAASSSKSAPPPPASHASKPPAAEGASSAADAAAPAAAPPAVKAAPSADSDAASFDGCAFGGAPLEGGRSCSLNGVLPFDPRFQRGTPKTPPRKKCESCDALNPTARQYCVNCGARFNIKQKAAGRKRTGGGDDAEAVIADGAPTAEERADGESVGGESSSGGGGGGGRSKACPACGQLNALSRLSCMLCAAKFSVKHTAALLSERYPSRASGGEHEYAELETSFDEPAACSSELADVSTASFKMLPLDAQIQVMQEKAAHRLLAQTLHQQMLEELHKNPALAADPDQQLQFKRLAQQQLLYQMALAAQASTPDEELGMSGAHEVPLDAHLHDGDDDAYGLVEMEAMEGVAWELQAAAAAAAAAGDDHMGAPAAQGAQLHRRRTHVDDALDLADMDAMDGAAWELQAAGEDGVRDSWDISNDARRGRKDMHKHAPRSGKGGFDVGHILGNCSTDGDDMHGSEDDQPISRMHHQSHHTGESSGSGESETVEMLEDGDFGFGEFHTIRKQESSHHPHGSPGAKVSSTRQVEGGKPRNRLSSKPQKRPPSRKPEKLPRVRLVLAGVSAAMPKVASPAACDGEVKQQLTLSTMLPDAKSAKPTKRRAWLSVEEQSGMKFPQSAASSRLLKQLADFNPSGKDDSAPNVLLPNEHEAKERGTSWRLTTDEDGAVMLGMRSPDASAHSPDMCGDAVMQPGFAEGAMNEMEAEEARRDGGQQLEAAMAEVTEASTFSNSVFMDEPRDDVMGTQSGEGTSDGGDVAQDHSSRVEHVAWKPKIGDEADISTLPVAPKRQKVDIQQSPMPPLPPHLAQKLRAGAPGDFSNVVAPVIKHSPLAPADSLRREVSMDAAGMLMTLRPATPTTDTLDVGPLRSCCDGSEEHLLSDVSLESASRNEEDYPSAGLPREDFQADRPEPIFGDNGADLATPIMH